MNNFLLRLAFQNNVDRKLIANLNKFNRFYFYFMNILYSTSYPRL